MLSIHKLLNYVDRRKYLIVLFLAHTGEQKLHYVGHSQGGTVFLVLNSMKTEYNDKIASAHLLAGVGYMANFPNAPLRTIAAMTTPIYVSMIYLRYECLCCQVALIADF